MSTVPDDSSGMSVVTSDAKQGDIIDGVGTCMSTVPDDSRGMSVVTSDAKQGDIIVWITGIM